MSMFDQNPAIRNSYRAGTTEDPYVSINESLQVVNGTAMLSEIPDEYTRVTVTNSDGTQLSEKQSIDLGTGEFYVNYTSGIVYFDSLYNSGMLNFSYKGVGIQYISDKRIFTKIQNGDVSETLSSLTQGTQQVKNDLDQLSITMQDNEDIRQSQESSRQTNEQSRNSAESSRESNETTRQQQESTRQANTSKAISDVESATTNANDSASYATDQGDYAKSQGDNLSHVGTHDFSLAYKKNNIVEDNKGEAYIAIQDVPTDIAINDTSYWKKISYTHHWEGMYDTNKYYDKNDYVSDTDNENVYVSLADNNIGNPLSDTNVWRLVFNGKNTLDSLQESEATISSNEDTRKSQESTRQSNENKRILNEDERNTSESNRITSESTRSDNESNRVTQENSRESAETTRESNESTRSTQETTRENNESSRVSSEDTRVLNEDARISSENTRETNEGSRQSQETTRQNNESTRETNESNRVSSENTRDTNETNRESAEDQRGLNEQDRISSEDSRVVSEGNRQTNETNRKDAESSRSTAESTRDSNETTRQSQESTRQTNETSRNNEEQTRISNEDSRVTAESNRETSEQTRKSNETTRQSQESTRQTNEQARSSNESTRQSNEQVRQDTLVDMENIINNTEYISEWSSTSTYSKNNIVKYNGSSFISLQDGNTGHTPNKSQDTSYWGVLAIKGTDGKGSISTVNGLSPDAEGNLSLVASDVNAESVNNKGVSNGYAGLDSNAKVPYSQLPDTAKTSTTVVADSTERNALTGMVEGQKAFETQTGDSYIWDGASWLIMADADWANVELDWSNINNKPTSTTSEIDASVNNSHTHTNKTILDNTEESYTTIEKDKLSGIEANAQVNSVDSVNNQTGAVNLSASDVGAETPTGAQSKADSAEQSAKDYAEPSFAKSTGFNKDFGTTAGTVAEGNHTHNDLHSHSNKTILDATEEPYTTVEKNKLSNIESGAEANDVNSVNGQTGSVNLSSADVNAEPSFTKNTAFNKNFGITTGTVSEGNHTHSELHTHSNKTTIDNLSDDGSGGLQYNGSPVGEVTQTDFDGHTTNNSNPHNVTASQVGAPTQTEHDNLSDAVTTHQADETNPHNVTASQAGAEPAFAKNTAFNKNFGTTSGTVAQGNHNHSGVYEPVLNANQKRKITFGTSEPSGGSDGDIYFQYE